MNESSSTHHRSVSPSSDKQKKKPKGQTDGHSLLPFKKKKRKNGGDGESSSSATLESSADRPKSGSNSYQTLMVRK
jgi:hypothetical protein